MTGRPDVEALEAEAAWAVREELARAPAAGAAPAVEAAR